MHVQFDELYSDSKFKFIEGGTSLNAKSEASLQCVRGLTLSEDQSNKCVKMEMTPLGRWCRFCSAETAAGIYLFGEESRRTFLHAKIRRYLSLTICVEDKLPKIICEECFRKLDSFHRFATMTVRNQERMSKLFSNNTSSNSLEPPESKSLLHTYLTKGIKEKDTPVESEITEMEVRVDPMMILQCCLDNDPEEEEAEEEPVHEMSLSENENNYENKKPQNHVAGKRILNSSDNMPVHHSQSQTTEGEKQTDKLDSSQEEEEEEDADSDDPNDECQHPFSCPICGKSISTKGNLKVHLETHRPKGKYGCDICGRIFKTQCNLFRHKEYHGGVQYPCSVCGRVYPTNSTLRAHSITHSDLRPHKCPLCDKTFKRNQDLKFHINQHTGARPYQCPYCPKAFASSGNCFSHRKRMHPVEVERDRERAAKIMR